MTLSRLAFDIADATEFLGISASRAQPDASRLAKEIRR
jgi:hypothetical protein